MRQGGFPQQVPRVEQAVQAQKQLPERPQEQQETEPLPPSLSSCSRRSQKGAYQRELLTTSCVPGDERSGYGL